VGQNAGGVPGIYAVDGLNNPYFNGDGGDAHIEHEMFHYVSGLSDIAIVSIYGIPLTDEKGKAIPPGEAVQNWFDHDCPVK